MLPSKIVLTLSSSAIHGIHCKAVFACTGASFVATGVRGSGTSFSSSATNFSSSSEEFPKIGCASSAAASSTVATVDSSTTWFGVWGNDSERDPLDVGAPLAVCERDALERVNFVM